jgi:hypothetical protein
MGLLDLFERERALSHEAAEPLMQARKALFDAVGSIEMISPIADAVIKEAVNKVDEPAEAHRARVETPLPSNVISLDAYRAEKETKTAPDDEDRAGRVNSALDAVARSYTQLTEPNPSNSVDYPEVAGL